MCALRYALRLWDSELEESKCCHLVLIGLSAIITSRIIFDNTEDLSMEIEEQLNVMRSIDNNFDEIIKELRGFGT